jgi:predicted RNA-binding protein associated with RNAse of E/G family
MTERHKYARHIRRIIGNEMWIDNRTEDELRHIAETLDLIDRPADPIARAYELEPHALLVGPDGETCILAGPSDKKFYIQPRFDRCGLQTDCYADTGEVITVRVFRFTDSTARTGK